MCSIYWYDCSSLRILFQLDIGGLSIEHPEELASSPGETRERPLNLPPVYSGHLKCPNCPVAIPLGSQVP